MRGRPRAYFDAPGGTQVCRPGDRRDGGAPRRRHRERGWRVPHLDRYRRDQRRRARGGRRPARRAGRGRSVRPQHDHADARRLARAGAGLGCGRRAGRHPARPRRQRRAVAGGGARPRHDGALARLRSRDRTARPRVAWDIGRRAYPAGSHRCGEQRARHVHPDRRRGGTGPARRATHWCSSTPSSRCRTAQPMWGRSAATCWPARRTSCSVRTRACCGRGRACSTAASTRSAPRRAPACGRWRRERPRSRGRPECSARSAISSGWARWRTRPPTAAARGWSPQ